MMRKSRRVFIIGGLAVVASGGVSAAKIYTPKGEGFGREYSKLEFSNEMFLDRLSESVWSIAVRLVAIGMYRRSHVHVVLQIATSESFGQLVYSKMFVINPGEPFWIKHKFINEYVASKLYVRFVVVDTSSDSLIGKSLYRRSLAISKTKEMAPW